MGKTINEAVLICRVHNTHTAPKRGVKLNAKVQGGGASVLEVYSNSSGVKKSQNELKCTLFHYVSD